MDKSIREKYRKPVPPKRRLSRRQRSSLCQRRSRIFSREMRIRRSTTLMELPSHKLSTVSVSKDIMMSPALQRKMTSIEVYKLRRQSSIARPRIDSDQVEDVVKLLVSERKTTGRKAEDELKQMNAKLSVRRQIKYALDMYKMLEEERIPLYEILFSCLGKCFSRVRGTWIRIKHFLDVWREPIKYMYGHYGTEIASYFVFVRYLILLNLVNVLIVALFIVAPQAYRDVKYGYNDTNYTAFYVSDLVTGSGYLASTLMYYGHYTNETFEVVTGRRYHFPLAYVLSIVFIMIINLLFVAYSLSREYRKSVAVMPSSKTQFSSKVLSSWDYGIITEVAAALKKESIHAELMELLNAKHKADVNAKSGLGWIEIIGPVILNVAVLALSFTTVYIIYTKLTRFNYDQELTVLQALSIPLVVPVAVLVFYCILKFLSSFESYLSKENLMHFTALRICLFRLSILGVLIYFWYTSSFSGRREELCIENYKGEEVFRLTLINFMCDTMVLIGISFLWQVIDNFLLCYIFSHYVPEFNVPFHINDLIYYQTMVWIGVFTFPLVPVMVMVILLLNFYLMKWGVKYLFKPRRGIVSARLSHTVHLLILFMCFVLVLIVASYFLFFSKPSVTCGPFRNYEYPYEVVNKWINIIVMHDISFGTFLNIFRTPGFLISAFLLLLVCVNVTRANAVGYKKTVNYLEEQLVKVGTDKVYLLEIYEKMK